MVHRNSLLKQERKIFIRDVTLLYLQGFGCIDVVIGTNELIRVFKAFPKSTRRSLARLSLRQLFLFFSFLKDTIIFLSLRYLRDLEVLIFSTSPGIWMTQGGND